LDEILTKTDYPEPVQRVSCLRDEFLDRTGNNHINAEGQIKLGKIAASAVEEFYKAKE
jgi:hypothetical protein